jgi:hypothetical protein
MQNHLVVATYAQAEAHRAGTDAHLNGQANDIERYLREHPLPPVTLEAMVRYAYQMGWDRAFDFQRGLAEALHAVGRHEEAAALEAQADAVR